MATIKLKDALANGLNTSEGIKASGPVPIEYTDTVWDDLRFPTTSTKIGTNLKPDFDQTNIGLLFPENDQAEVIYMNVQFPHKRKNGSNISPHIHYIQDGLTAATFVMEYRWYKNGGPVPATWTTIESTGGVFPYVSGTLLQIVSFPDIDGSALDTVSSMMDIKLYRKTGDGVAGDVLVKEFDIHYQIDSAGSKDEFTK